MMAVVNSTKLWASFLIITFIVSLIGVGQAVGAPKYGGTIVMGAAQEASSIDVHQARGGNSRTQVGQYNGYLIYTNSTGDMFPGLATSWEFTDPKTLLIHLKKGVTFQDGTDFNADAVKFNFDRIAGKTTPKITSTGSSVVGKWASYEVVDPYTFKINLKRIEAGLLTNLHTWWSAMVSPSAVRKSGERFPLRPVGCGPFVLKKYLPGSQIQYEKFDGYWKKDADGNKMPYLDKVKIMIIPDHATRAAALRSGTIHIDQGVLVKQAIQLRKDPKVEVRTIKGLGARFIAFNTGKPPLDNVILRKAINYAIDRNEIIASVLQGEGSVPTTWFGPISWAYDPTLKWYEYDQEKAKAAMREAGFPNGFSFKAANYNPAAKPEAEMIQAQLKRVGIDMQLDFIDLATFTTQYRQQALYHAGFTGYPMIGYDPTFLSLVFHFSKGPYTDPSKPTVYDATILKSGSMYDREKRKAVFAELHKQIYDRAGEAYYIWASAYRAYRTSVKGFQPQADQTSALEEIWLDK
jgi:ABC-type transport system substrate-binding protein